jgi:hypothetical protein
MNEQVEAIFTQIFAPEPIPESAIALFEKMLKFGSRIDRKQMRPEDLCLIAAISEMFRPDLGETTTLSAQPYAVSVTSSGALIDASEDEPETQTPPKTTNEAQKPVIASGGPMDAPKKPLKKIKAMTVGNMQKMVRKELIAHSKEFYGYDMPKNYSHKQMVAVLRSKEPIK